MLVAYLVLCLPAPAQRDLRQDAVHHDLEVRLEPESHAIEARDRITLPARLLPKADGELRFRLHADLQPEVQGYAFELKAVSEAAAADAGAGEHGASRARTWSLRPKTPGGWQDPMALILTWRGRIHHALQAEEQEYARSFARSAGLIDERGAVLSGSSFWIPAFGDELITFTLNVDVPEGWDVVSQGERTAHEVREGRRQVTWECPHPMDEAFLIAGPWTEYSRAAGEATAHAFLRDPDPNLAARYLEVTAQYLEMYRRLIGPYPYAKFALVENFWETGYGMPSFTLLGPQVIRLPFILHSSYPHEILHNWWGNSVFVDYASGNWCEGLTAYLADHLIKEGQGQGVDYRRDALKRYRNYVRQGQDFPLTEFRSRHSSATEAVGYGKSLMLFHMLRRDLGDARFTQGLQSFYRQFRFRRASFGDLEKAFSNVAERDLAPFFAQWVERTGAPELALGETRWNEADGGYFLHLELRQVQGGEPYALNVPIAVSLAGASEPFERTLAVDRTVQRFEIPLPARPLLLQVDPAFDLFRRLDRSEIPPSLGQLFGAPRVLLVLPGADDPLADGWRAFAESWTGSEQADVAIRGQDELEELPADRAVWLLGSTNRWASAVADGVLQYGAAVRDDAVDFGDVRVARADHCFALAAVHPKDSELAVAWLGADRADALPGLARKLPHYGKYSYLAFAGAEPANDAKGQWRAIESPMSRGFVTGRANPIELPAREPLARPAPVFDADRMLATVRWLADDERQGRGAGTEGLEQSADWIAERFAASGLRPGGDDGGWFQSWYEPGGPDGRPVLLRNVVGVLPGTRAEWDGQSVVVGAHYDHLGRGWPDARQGMAGRIHNGADDNASGVAVLLETARIVAAELRPQRSIVFVAFSGEEWGLKGSRQYVRSMLRWPITETLAMINLDTVGRLGEGTLQVLGTGTASEWVHIARGVGFTTGVQSQVIAGDPGGSDQKAFHEAGVPAVQLFTGGHAEYHHPDDDADKIDADGMVAVATFLREAIVYLSEREEPLTSSLTGTTVREGGEGTAPRRASLGTLPDFGFTGPGVRVAQVMPDSPAAAAGLRDGDVLLALDGVEIADLRGYSELLKEHAPGDRVEMRVRRGAEELRLEAVLGAR